MVSSKAAEFITWKKGGWHVAIPPSAIPSQAWLFLQQTGRSLWKTHNVRKNITELKFRNENPEMSSAGQSLIMPKLWIWSLYGTFTWELDSMVLQEHSNSEHSVKPFLCSRETVLLAEISAVCLWPFLPGILLLSQEEELSCRAAVGGSWVAPVPAQCGQLIHTRIASVPPANGGTTANWPSEELPKNESKQLHCAWEPQQEGFSSTWSKFMEIAQIPSTF